MTSYHGWTHAPKEMGGTDPIPFTGSVYHFVVFEDDVPVVSGDGAFIFHIPADLDGMRLAEVEINVETASSSGIVQVQIHNITQAVDMLSTRVQVDANELHSKDAATAAVVDVANDVVAHGDRIRVDVDAAGTGALGLDVVLRFFTVAGFQLRGPTGSQGATGAQGSQGIQGPQGDPGGITAWEGPWTTATGYSIGDAVSNNGSSYAARTNHTSGASSEPGVGASWETDWMLLAAAGAAGEAGVAEDGWVADGDVWTYASATTFTVSGDQTAKFSKGTRIKLTQTTVKYFVVVASSYSNPTTTVTITGGIDYTFANATVDDPFYSYMANPQGYPGWFNYTPTLTAATTNPTLGSGSTAAGRFSVVGQVVSAVVDITFGSSGSAAGSGEYRVSLPAGAASSISGFFVGNALLYDSSVNTGRVGSINLDASLDIVRVWVDSATSYWTHASPWAWAASDQIKLSFFYEIG